MRLKEIIEYERIKTAELIARSEALRAYSEKLILRGNALRDQLRKLFPLPAKK